LQPRATPALIPIEMTRKVRWSYIVGQFGSQVKVYSGI
jgi:hypothetical protein